MSRNRFVIPGVVRLPLSDGDWIDVKKELNAGEARAVFADLVKTMEAGSRAQLNPKLVGQTKLAQYIVGWSFVDAAGPIPFSVSALDNLDVDTYAELITVIDAHEEAVDQARAQRKNAQDGASTSSVISPSVAG